MRHPNRRTLPLLVLLAAVSLPVAAQDAGRQPQIEDEVKALRDSLQQTQSRLQALEEELRKARAQPVAPATVPAPAAAPQAAQAPAPASAAPAAAPSQTQEAVAPPAAQRAGAAVPESPATALRKAWAHVQPGTDSAEVLKLLGTPSSELQLNGKLAWYYAYPGVGAGSIFFNGDRTVSSRKSPFFELGW